VPSSSVPCFTLNLAKMSDRRTAHRKAAVICSENDDGLGNFEFPEGGAGGSNFAENKVTSSWGWTSCELTMQWRMSSIVS
jgi:hypothetical protein